MNQNILLTGASGFLGTIFSGSLVNMGFNLTTLGQRIGNSIQADLSNKEFCLNKEEQFNIIIHAAGKAHSIPKSEAEKKAFYSVNLDGTKNLCKAIEKLKVMPKSFIFISTVAVYGLDSGEMIDENYPLNGNTPYSVSKILAENWLMQWTKEHNITLSILRLPLIAGPNPPGNLGAMVKGIKSGFYLSVGAANARKSIVWGEDIAKVIPVLAMVGGIYNLTDGHHPTFRELEKAISFGYGKSEPLAIPSVMAKSLAKFGDWVQKFPINTNKLSKITSTLTFDDSSARKLIGWKPNSVLDILSEIL